MKLNVTIDKDATSQKYDSQSTIQLATALLLAMAQYFSKIIAIDAREFLPIFSRPGLLEMNGEAVELLPDSVFPKKIEELLESLHDAASLYTSMDTFLSTTVLNRPNWVADPRHPVLLRSDSTLGGTRAFNYDNPTDTLTCGILNLEIGIDESTALLKAIAKASAAGYSIEIILDGKKIELPAAHMKWFCYKSGPGRVHTAPALLSGLLIDSQIAEVKIHNGTVQQVSVSNAAMPAILNCAFPASCFIKYSFASCYSPLDRKKGKLTIEEITEVREQKSLDLRPQRDEI